MFANNTFVGIWSVLHYSLYATWESMALRLFFERLSENYSAAYSQLGLPADGVVQRSSKTFQSVSKV
jgi:hypothetical protein